MVCALFICLFGLGSFMSSDSLVFRSLSLTHLCVFVLSLLSLIVVIVLYLPGIMPYTTFSGSFSYGRDFPDFGGQKLRRRRVCREVMRHEAARGSQPHWHVFRPGLPWTSHGWIPCSPRPPATSYQGSSNKWRRRAGDPREPLERQKDTWCPRIALEQEQHDES